MAQHDFNINNQSAPAFRGDLNNALEALVTLSSGATAPATTYAGMIWHDTAANTLYIRSDADDAWIALGTLDQSANTFTPVNQSPAGQVVWFAANGAPTGYLKANGAAASRSTYAALFAVIGTTFGVGDGSTTFNLPDLRGEFVRGWDDARGVDAGRVFGSAQAAEFESHSHTLFRNTGGAGGTANSVPSYPSVGLTGEATGSSSYGGGALAQATGGAETRPRNIALLACIKY